jgi:transposase
MNPKHDTKAIGLSGLYPVSEVSERLGVSAHSLYRWVKAVRPDKSQEQAAELIAAKSEILKLRS